MSRIPVGVTLIALAWALHALAGWTTLGPYPRAALLAVPPLAIAGVAVLNHAPRVALLLAGAAAAVHLLTYDPFFDPHCERTCLAAPTPLSAALGLRPATLLTTGLALAAAIAATAPRRAAQPWPVRLAYAGTAALTVAALGAPLTSRPALASTLMSAAVVLAPGAVCADLLRVRRTRRRVQHAVAQLTGAVTGTLRGPVHAVHFAVADERTESSGAPTTWLDAAGRPVPPDGRDAAVLSDDGQPAVRMILAPRADRDLAVAAITPAMRLSLLNARLRANAEHQLAQLQASQRRIVETADAERRRIERDLHDGAQQRLVAVTMQLSSARTAVIAGPATELDAIAEADRHVRQALAALRAQSTESFAAVLATEGLAAAVEDLLARCPVPATLTVALSGAELGWPAQRAALAAVAEALDNVARHAGANHARIDITDDGSWLTVRVADDGPGGATAGDGLTAVGDRAGALGGRMRLLSPPGAGTTVEVRLPCG